MMDVRIVPKEPSSIPAKVTVTGRSYKPRSSRSERRPRSTRGAGTIMPGLSSGDGACPTSKISGVRFSTPVPISTDEVQDSSCGPGFNSQRLHHHGGSTSVCVLATGAPATIRGRTGFDVTVKGHGGEGQATSLTAQTTNADSEEFALPLAA